MQVLLTNLSEIKYPKSQYTSWITFMHLKCICL